MASVAMTGALAIAASAGPPAAQTPLHAGDVPQAMRQDQDAAVRHVTDLSQREPPVGLVTKEALATMREHQAWERGYILPPLTLLQSLSDGKVSPNMKWAIAMAVYDRPEAIQGPTNIDCNGPVAFMPRYHGGKRTATDASASIVV